MGAAGKTNVRLGVSTDYPWHGRVSVHIVQTPEQPWTLSSAGSRMVRIGHHYRTRRCRAHTREVGNGRAVRIWRPGDVVTLDLDLPVRATEPNPRIDAVRGCIAFERGPLVYCIESADVPPQLSLRTFAGILNESLRRLPGPTLVMASSESPCRYVIPHLAMPWRPGRFRTSPGPTAGSRGCACGFHGELAPASQLSRGGAVESRTINDGPKTVRVGSRSPPGFRARLTASATA